MLGRVVVKFSVDYCMVLVAEGLPGGAPAASLLV